MPSVFALLFGHLLNRWRRRRRMRELQPQDRIMCALRVETGDAPPLDRRWRHGEAELVRGQIRFQTGSKDRMNLTVRDVAEHVERRPRLKELWRDVDPGYRIVRVETGKATLEWALPAPWKEWAVGKIRRPRPVSG